MQNGAFCISKRQASIYIKHMYNAKVYSAASATSPAVPNTITRRDPTEHDVQIEILYCGICHSDLHQVRNEWSEFMPTVYPCVPGHEIVGRVTKAGSSVTKFKPGDLAAVGCMGDSDRTCPEYLAGLEQFCPNPTFTYNFPDKHTPRWHHHPRRCAEQASHLGGSSTGSLARTTACKGSIVTGTNSICKEKRCKSANLEKAT